MQIKKTSDKVRTGQLASFGGRSSSRAPQLQKGRCGMKEAEATNSSFAETAKTGYVIALLVTLGVFAAISAVLIAWPALAYLGSKLM